MSKDSDVEHEEENIYAVLEVGFVKLAWSVVMIRPR